MTHRTVDLSPMVVGRGRYWGPPFIMSVVSHRVIFDILGRYVGPEGDVEGEPGRRKLAPADHFARTVTPFVVGYTRRRDDSYARRLREAHERNNVPGELIGRSVSWQLTIMCTDALRRTDLYDLVEAAEAAAPTLASDFGGDPEFAVLDLKGLHDTFRPFEVSPEMLDAFWSIMDAPSIRRALGIPEDATAGDILDDILDGSLMPYELVNQYRR